MTNTTSLHLMDLMDRFATDDKCRDFLEELRWPQGNMSCVRCGSKAFTEIPDRNQ